nr:MAG TPA: hypothetical protein [Caudoviricetes sp.]
MACRSITKDTITYNVVYYPYHSVKINRQRGMGQ